MFVLEIAAFGANVGFAFLNYRQARRNYLNGLFRASKDDIRQERSAISKLAESSREVLASVRDNLHEPLRQFSIAATGTMEEIFREFNALDASLANWSPENGGPEALRELADDMTMFLDACICGSIEGLPVHKVNSLYDSVWHIEFSVDHYLAHLDPATLNTRRIYLDAAGERFKTQHGFEHYIRNNEAFAYWACSLGTRLSLLQRRHLANNVYRRLTDFQTVVQHIRALVRSEIKRLEALLAPRPYDEIVISDVPALEVELVAELGRLKAVEAFDVSRFHYEKDWRLLDPPADYVDEGPPHPLPLESVFFILVMLTRAVRSGDGPTFNNIFIKTAL